MHLGEESLKKIKKLDCVPTWGPPPPYFGTPQSIIFVWSINQPKITLNIFGNFVFFSSPNTTHSPPPGTGTVACISHDIRFVCIKVSQIFTVTHVGEAKFVISKIKEILNKNLGLGQTPPLLGLCPKFFHFFKSDSSP